MSHVPAESIEAVLVRLDEILERSKDERSRLGYFAALYRRVTAEVKRRIDADFFDDNDRMRSLDVIFANRYLEAYDRDRAGESITDSWRTTFDMASDVWPIVLQHLLVGMNAHINLDLGVAAAFAAPGAALPALRTDFNRINEVLQELTESVYEGLGTIWPLLRVLKGRLGTFDSEVLNFSMTTARDGAWRFAQRLNAFDTSRHVELIRARDVDIARISKLVQHPGVVASTVTKIIRVGERQSIPDIISILS